MHLRNAWDRSAKVLVTLGLLVLVMPGAARAQPPDPLSWIPPDGVGFIRLRLADLWKHPSAQEARGQLAKAGLDLEKEMLSNLGLKPSEVEQVILLIPPPGGHAVFLVTTTVPAEEKLLKALAGPISKLAHKDRTYYTGRDGTASYPVGERFFVLGPTDVVLKLVDQANVKRADGPLSDGLKLAAKPAVLVASVNTTVLAKGFKGTLPQAVEAALPLFEADPAVFTVVSTEDTTLTMRLTCASEKDAKAKAQVLLTTIDLLRQLVPVGRVELGKQKAEDDAQKWLFGQADKFLDNLQEACKTARAEAKGRVVYGEMRGKVSAGDWATLAAGWFTLRQGKGGGAD